MIQIKQGTIYPVSRPAALSILVLAVLTFALAACGGEQTNPTNPSAANPTPTVQKSPTPTTPPSPTPTVQITTTPVIPGGPDLNEFSPPGGNFTVYLPDKPQPYKVSIIANHDGSVSDQTYTTSNRKDGVLFLVSYQNYPEEYLKQNSPEKILAAQGTHLSAQKEVTMKSQKDITLGQTVPGKEYVYGAQGWGLFVQRYYMSGSRLYSIAAVGVYGATPSYVYTIFDTFKLKS